MNKSLLFLGALDFPNIPKAGDAIKNRYLVDFFKQHLAVDFVDTQRWKKNPMILLRMLYLIIFRHFDNIVISASNVSAYRMISLFNRIHLKHTKVFYFMIGGYTPIKIKQGIYKAEPFKCLERIVVEADKVCDFYKEVGLTNTYRLYNFKPTSFYPKPKKVASGKKRFIFLSRLTELKGIFHILESARRLNEKGFADAFEIDFYGRIDQDVNDRFLDEVSQISNVEYKGFLNLNEESNYTILSQYDVMLFPTMHPTEGFPGAIADAAIAGLPVIASNWNYAEEIIVKPRCGVVFPVGDTEALTQLMYNAINHPEQFVSMQQCCIEQSKLYRCDEVLTKEFLINIGMNV